MVAQPSPGASSIPLSIDPVIGWRLWCIRLDAHDVVSLTSPLKTGYVWRPMEPNHAGCAIHVGRGVPTFGCGCGLYAVSALERLSAAFGMTGEAVGVVGSVAMWGRVVEHAAGTAGSSRTPTGCD
ncbi:MAG: hypothetical protein L0206_13310 [Actinobacteria bacterium]|nr:hypothetical protein [Actinomycetota bacterium]